MRTNKGAWNEWNCTQCGLGDHLRLPIWPLFVFATIEMTVLRTAKCGDAVKLLV